MFTKQRNYIAGNRFVRSCILFIIAFGILAGLLWWGAGCGHNPIKVNMEPAKIITEEAISFAGYLVGKKYPIESGVALVVADVMIHNGRPLQDIVNATVSELEKAIEDEYLRMRCKRIMDNLHIEINTDGLILVEQGNELVETALHSFLAGLRASQGVK